LDEHLLGVWERFDIGWHARDADADKVREAIPISENPSFSFMNGDTDQ
jgi:hypothetical protein